MSWDYRVVEYTDTFGETYLAVCVVYYDSDGNPLSHSDPTHPVGDSFDELRQDMEKMQQALKRPKLLMKDFLEER